MELVCRTRGTAPMRVRPQAHLNSRPDLARALDIAGALLALVATSPVLLIAAMIVKATSRGPLFYRAVRIGQKGIPFCMLKFRTMAVACESDPPRITRANDPRVTPIGRVLRRTKIDELPQLINVLRGEMSLVGPRPEDPKYVELYSETQREVLDVRPGITSPASMAFRDEESMLAGEDWEEQYRTWIMPEKLRIELGYLRSRTLIADAGIIMKTVLTLFR